MTPKQMNKPKHKKEWFDDESFCRKFYPFMFSDRRFAETAELSKQLIKLVKPRGKYVLDLCCGLWRYSLALAKREFIDIKLYGNLEDDSYGPKSERLIAVGIKP